jgi:hypothetical protein
MSSAPTTALVVKTTAKPETRGEVAQFLTDALELAKAEAGTPSGSQNADHLLATAPEILPADVLAAKVPGPQALCPGRPEERAPSGQRQSGRGVADGHEHFPRNRPQRRPPP